LGGTLKEVEVKYIESYLPGKKVNTLIGLVNQPYIGVLPTMENNPASPGLASY
jgi:hypothetical protein